MDFGLGCTLSLQRDSDELSLTLRAAAGQGRVKGYVVEGEGSAINYPKTNYYQVCLLKLDVCMRSAAEIISD